MCYEGCQNDADCNSSLQPTDAELTGNQPENDDNQQQRVQYKYYFVEFCHC